MDFCVLSDHRHANGTDGAFLPLLLSAGQAALFIAEGQKTPYFLFFPLVPRFQWNGSGASATGFRSVAIITIPARITAPPAINCAVIGSCKIA
jgi:hypothetical protein